MKSKVVTYHPKIHVTDGDCYIQNPINKLFAGTPSEKEPKNKKIKYRPKPDEIDSIAVGVFLLLINSTKLSVGCEEFLHVLMAEQNI